ncbi:MAG: nucleoside deaminase [Candidatus Diapherotrites archaeon]|nr:nucleoside deaminase [Candidatus Diapherotrites archaeon]
MNKKDLMIRAVLEASKNLKSLDGGPFGAVIARKGRVLAVAHNTVLRTKDPSCHAEVNAIRLAARKLKSFDLSGGSELFSTTEPCPMCFSAIHWARIDHVYYGTTIADVGKLGFNELAIPASRMKRLGQSRVKLTKGFLKTECAELLKRWKSLPIRPVY